MRHIRHNSRKSITYYVPSNGFSPPAKPEPEPIAVTAYNTPVRDKIIAYLNSSPDRTCAKQDIRMRMRHRTDFELVYAALLADGIIEEFDLGIKGRPRKVCLSFKFTFAEYMKNNPNG